MTAGTVDLLTPASRRFFDWASASPLSLPARQAREEFNRRSAAAADPPAFLRSETGNLSALRELLRRLLHAAPGQPVVLGRSAAELLSVLAAGLPASGRHTVVLAEPNHPVMQLAWQGAARRRQLNVICVPAGSRHRADLEAVRAATGPDCLAVCVTHVTHLHGGLQPVGDLADIAHQAGAVLIVDGAQAVGRIPVDLAELGCDAYIGVGRKALLSPLGTAFLTAGSDLLTRIEPLIWSTRSARTDGDPHHPVQVFPPPAGLEGSLPDLSALEALRASVQAILTVGVETVCRHVQAVLPVLEVSLARCGLRQLSPALDDTPNAGIMTFSLPAGTDGSLLQARLRESGYVVAADQHTLRVSIHLANDNDDVRALTEEVYQHGAAAAS